jgi:CheY-like chemotaxis protein
MQPKEPCHAGRRGAAIRPNPHSVVEDHELNLKLLADLLDFHGYLTMATGLGESAVDIACQQLPDLILLDIQLPDISGTEVAQRLKADPPDANSRTPRIIAVAAVVVAGAAFSPALLHLDQATFPNEPEKQQALDLCGRSDTNFVRFLASEREACYQRLTVAAAGGVQRPEIRQSFVHPARR